MSHTLSQPRSPLPFKLPPALLLVALSLSGFVVKEVRAAAPPKPNIVYFLIDDMGYADAGFNGCTDIKTPNFDKFAKEGAVLDCLYGQPVCSPTRACLMTGRYPVRTGVYNVVQYRQPKPWSLPLSERTLAQTLHDAGYTTAISGKWHLGDDTPAHLPTRRGFDHQYGFMGGGINSFLKASEKKSADWYRDDKKIEETGYSMHLIAREACRLIREQAAGKPLFLYVTPNAVHTPWLSPEEYQKPYAHLPERRKQLAGNPSRPDPRKSSFLSVTSPAPFSAPSSLCASSAEPRISISLLGRSSRSRSKSRHSRSNGGAPLNGSGTRSNTGGSL